MLIPRTVKTPDLTQHMAAALMSGHVLAVNRLPMVYELSCPRISYVVLTMLPGAKDTTLGLASSLVPTSTKGGSARLRAQIG